MEDETVSFPELTRRQEEILSLVVRAYTDKPEPVSSKHLVEAYDFGFSSATVRNELARLEEMGFIAAPHTSAGRIPTTMGYRYFVKRLINQSELSVIERKEIQQKFNTLPTVVEQWMRQAATILAHTVHSASWITPPASETALFKHVELISIQGRLSLMVLVLQGGTVQQRMLTLSESITQTHLSDVANRLNSLCAGLSANDVRMKSMQLPLLDREIAELAAELMDRVSRNHVRFFYRDGLSEIITTFQDSEGAQQAVRIFEQGAFLSMILDEVFTPLLEDNDVRVVIGGEGRWEELSHLSMVLSRYGVPGQVSGALGVLGPTHINYGRAIQTVRHVSSLMTEMLGDLYSESDESQSEDEENL